MCKSERMALYINRYESYPKAGTSNNYQKMQRNVPANIPSDIIRSWKLVNINTFPSTTLSFVLPPSPPISVPLSS